MLALFLAVLAAAWLIEAATDVNIDYYHPHAVVAFIRSGEKTPELIPSPSTLTPLGTQQMYTLGQLFRGRYIDADSGDTRLGKQPINGMNPDELDNDQIFIHSLDTPYVYASAQAFMQGLYPPSTGSNDTSFDGYQFPQIKSLSPRDPYSIYLAGQKYCPMSEQDSDMYEVTEDFQETRKAAENFYQNLDTDLYGAYLSSGELDYFFAEEIYEFIAYRYRHVESIRNNIDNGTLDQLRYYADTKAWYKYGNTSVATSEPLYRAMAGKTLAARILGKFQEVVFKKGEMDNGYANPLTLLFGDFEPFISLFALTMVDQKSTNLMAIPDFASTMVFELYSKGSDSSFPEDINNDLWVRFRFQNGTDYVKPDIQSYVMFNRANAEGDMTWVEFEDMFKRIMMNDPDEWCDECSSGSAFCRDSDDDDSTNASLSGNGHSKNGLSPVVAGVIGAIVTLAVAGLLFAFAMLLGGVRFHRVNRNRKSDLGGFKGNTKLASDPDLHLPNNAAPPAGIITGAGRRMPHERVGSWELRQKEMGARSGDIGDESRRESFEAIEAAMARPVQPSERV